MFSLKTMFSAIMANILLVASMATDHWVKYNFGNLGLWKCMSNDCASVFEKDIHFWNGVRALMVLSAILCFAGFLSLTPCINRTCAAGILFFVSTSCAAIALVVYAALIPQYLKGCCLSWSYILGWVGSSMTFSAGIFSCGNCKREE